MKRFFYLNFIFLGFLICPWLVCAATISTETITSLSAAVNDIESAIAIDSQNSLYLSFYNTATQQINYATLANGTTSWAISAIDPNATVHFPHNDIALDAAENPHVVYYDDTNDALMHGSLSGGVWTREVIATFVGTHTYVSLGIGSDDVPRVMYNDTASSSVKFAENKGEGWNAYTVMNSTMISPGDLAMGAVPGDYGNISYMGFTYYSNPLSVYALAWAQPTENDPIIGAVGISSVTAITSPAGNVSMAFGSFYNAIYISYYDTSTMKLMYQIWGAIPPTEVTGDVSAGDDPGRHSSIAVDSSGYAYISYLDDDKYLKIAKFNGHPWDPSSSWGILSIDSGTLTGLGNDLVLNSFDSFYTSYICGSTPSVKLGTDAGMHMSFMGRAVDQSGVGISSVTMTLTGSIDTQTTSTASDGSYSFTGLMEGSYTVTPSFAGELTFVPSSRVFSIFQSTQTGQDFVGRSYGVSLVNNLFNPLAGGQAAITYSVDTGQVVIRLYTLQGRLIRKLVDEYRAAGSYTVNWDGRNEDNEVVASGIYLMRIEAEGVKQTRRIAVIK